MLSMQVVDTCMTFVVLCPSCKAISPNCIVSAWIDDRTRAVMIQISLYNPNIQMFSSVTLLVEFLSTGSLIPTARFEPMDLQSEFFSGDREREMKMMLLFDVDFSSLFDLIISLIYLLFIVYLMIDEIRLLLSGKWMYFRQVWSYMNWGIIVCSWMGVGIYVWRQREMTRIGDLFQSTNGDVYINLQLAAYVNDLLTFVLGFCCFFASIKLLRFSRYARRLSVFGDALHHAIKDLLSFTVCFALMFLGFIVLFYLLFVSKMWTCSTLLHTAQMLFELILMKFDASDIRSADPLLGPSCITLFVLFVVFIGMTMFISIINDSFRIVRQNGRAALNEDREMFAFIWNRFQLWTGDLSPSRGFRLNSSTVGWRQLSEEELQKKQDEHQRSEYYDPIERFPDRIDQLLEGLNRVSVTDAVFIRAKQNSLFRFRSMLINRQRQQASNQCVSMHPVVHVLDGIIHQRHESLNNEKGRLVIVVRFIFDVIFALLPVCDMQFSLECSQFIQ